MNRFDDLHPSFQELAFTFQYLINLGFSHKKLFSFIDEGKLYAELDCQLPNQPLIKFITPVGKFKQELSLENLQEKVSQAYDLLLKLPEDEIIKYWNKSFSKKAMPSIIQQLKNYQIPIPKLMN